jgi:hypothetical protein
MQQVLEDEVTEFLGRERYARAGEGEADLSLRQVDGRPDLPGHPGALPRVVRVGRRDLSSCTRPTSPPRASWSPGASRSSDRDAFAGKGGYVADAKGDDLADPGAGAERDEGERLVAWRGQAWTARR